MEQYLGELETIMPTSLEEYLASVEMRRVTEKTPAPYYLNSAFFIN